MPRNLDRRIELLFPVESPEGRQKVLAALDAVFHDNVKARRLAGGRHLQAPPPGEGRGGAAARRSSSTARRSAPSTAPAPGRASPSSRCARPRSEVSDEPRRIARRALFGRLLPQAPEAGHWVKVHRTAMACRFEVTLDSADARHVDAARAALDEVDAIEDALIVVPRHERGVAAEPCRPPPAPVPVSPGPLHPALPLPRAARRHRRSLRPGQHRPLAVLGVPRPAPAPARGRGDRHGPGPLRHGQGRARRHGPRGPLRRPRRRAQLRSGGEGLGPRPGRRLDAGARVSRGPS